MDDRDAARAELEALEAHPEVRARFPGGLDVDAVVAALHALGRVHLRVRDGGPDLLGRPTARFSCAVELRDAPAGVAVGRGHTLAAAAVRCLLDAEGELREVVQRGLDAFGTFLDAA